MQRKEKGRCQSCWAPIDVEAVTDAEGIKYGPILCKKCEAEKSGIPERR